MAENADKIELIGELKEGLSEIHPPKEETEKEGEQKPEETEKEGEQKPEETEKEGEQKPKETEKEGEQKPKETEKEGKQKPKETEKEGEQKPKGPPLKKDSDLCRASSTSAFTAVFWSVVAFFKPGYEKFKDTHNSTKRMCNYLESVWVDWEKFHDQYPSTWDIPWKDLIEKARQSRKNVMDYLKSGSVALELMFEIWYTSHQKLRKHFTVIQRLHDYIIPMPTGMKPFYPLSEKDKASIREHCFQMNMNLVQRGFHSSSKFLENMRNYLTSTVTGALEFPRPKVVAYPEAFEALIALFKRKEANRADLVALEVLVKGKTEDQGPLAALDALKNGKIPDRADFAALTALKICAVEEEHIRAFHFLQALYVSENEKKTCPADDADFNTILSNEQPVLRAALKLDAKKDPAALDPLKSLRDYIIGEVRKPATLAAIRAVVVKKVVNPAALEALNALIDGKDANPTSLDVLDALVSEAGDPAADQALQDLKAKEEADHAALQELVVGKVEDTVALAAFLALADRKKPNPVQYAALWSLAVEGVEPTVPAVEGVEPTVPAVEGVEPTVPAVE